LGATVLLIWVLFFGWIDPGPRIAALPGQDDTQLRAAQSCAEAVLADSRGPTLVRALDPSRPPPIPELPPQFLPSRVPLGLFPRQSADGSDAKPSDGALAIAVFNGPRSSRGPPLPAV